MSLENFLKDGKPSSNTKGKKCEAIIKLKPSKSPKDCRSFYGIVCFDFSKISENISYEIQKRKTNFNGLKHVKVFLSKSNLYGLPHLYYLC